jgi:hypothetical protein
MALPLQRDLFPTLRLTPPDTMSILRAIGPMPRDVLALVRHLRKHSVTNG